jgi:hypothetical protein
MIFNYFGVYLRIDGSPGIPMLNFWGILDCFPKTAQLYILTRSLCGFHFFHHLTNICFHLTLGLWPSLWVWSCVHCIGFDLHSPDD